MHADSKVKIYSQIWRGHIHWTKMPMQEFWAKMRGFLGEGGLYTLRAAYICGILQYMCTWIYHYMYLSWYCHGDGLHKPLRLQLIVSHHLTLHILQLSLWHVAHASLRILGLVHAQEEYVGRGIGDLKVSNGRITL